MADASGLEAPKISALAALRGVVDELDLYLVGGSAVAAHLGHRHSIGLDLCSRQHLGDVERFGRALRRHKVPFRVLAKTEVTLHAVIDDVKVDFVDYVYGPLEPTARGPAGVQMASLLDLSTMKLATISTRGIRRDFWDLYAICEAGVELSDALRAYRNKFGVEEPDLYHVVRSRACWFSRSLRSLRNPARPMRCQLSPLRKLRCARASPSGRTPLARLRRPL